MTSGNDMVAPWTDEEVRSLNDFQHAGFVHPFTCGRQCPHASLLATPAGWICPTCDYTQDWAHDWMADRRWEALRPPWA